MERCPNMVRRWIVLVLVLTAGIGMMREWKAATITAPLRAQLHAPLSASALALVNRAVSAHFTEGAGLPEPTTEPLWLHTAADRLIESGGQCGHAAEAMGAVLDQLGVPFRILRVDVQDNGANHVMIEVLSSDGRWVLMDPLRNEPFFDPRNQRHFTLDEIRALNGDERALVPEVYWTTWPLDATVDRSVVKSMMIEPGGEVALACMVMAGLMVWRPRPRRPSTREDSST